MDARSGGDSALRSAAEGSFATGVEPLVARRKVPAGFLGNVTKALVESRRYMLEEAKQSGDANRTSAAEFDLGRTLLVAERSLLESSEGGSPAQKAPAGMAREALSIALRSLTRNPDDARTLSLAADAAVDSGDLKTAREILARLVNGLPTRSDLWFERKCDLCLVLSRLDPDEARKVLAQHVALIPEWGPGKYGARLKALASELGLKNPNAAAEEERKR